ncbi:MAG TPA: hypothetical protein VKM55_00405 [Candidatus Lokiarchaeia archaeon]|nr:hypothetical protein [Candidatus Lokiarchaeia archaeon]
MLNKNSIVTEADILDMIREGSDALNIRNEDDFSDDEEYEEYEARCERVRDTIYEIIYRLDGRMVDMDAFNKIMNFLEAHPSRVPSHYIKEMSFPQDTSVACIVDLLTKSETNHYGDPVVYILLLK